MRGVRQFTRLARQAIPQAIILLYHRVAETTFDPQLLCVSPKNFADHMEILRTTCRPLSLGELATRKSLNLWRSRTVIVTFDDGYADNFLNAMPILRQYEIPATVFVATGFIGTERTPYWDELSSILLQVPTLPPKLTLLMDGEMKTWEFDGEPTVDGAWDVLQEGDLARHDAYRTLCDHLRSLPSHMREETMVNIRKWSEKDETVAANNQFMTVEQLRRLTDDGLIAAGAHTMTHPNLASLSSQEQREEIVGGRRQLEEMTGHKVTSFAYPYGGREHYTRETVQIIKEQGFACACSNFEGKVWCASDRYQLPRILVRDWAADEFARIIDSYFYCMR